MTPKQRELKKMRVAFRTAGLDEEVCSAIEDYVDAAIDEVKEDLERRISHVEGQIS